MKTIILSVLLLTSCGKNTTSTSQPSQKASPVLNPVTEYFCKDEPICKKDCDDKKVLCYSECDNLYRGNNLEIRNCKVFKCDGNHNTCLQEVYSR